MLRMLTGNQGYGVRGLCSAEPARTYGLAQLQWQSKGSGSQNATYSIIKRVNLESFCASYPGIHANEVDARAVLETNNREGYRAANTAGSSAQPYRMIHIPGRSPILRSFLGSSWRSSVSAAAVTAVLHARSAAAEATRTTLCASRCRNLHAARAAGYFAIIVSAWRAVPLAGVVDIAGRAGDSLHCTNMHWFVVATTTDRPASVRLPPSLQCDGVGSQ